MSRCLPIALLVLMATGSADALNLYSFFDASCRRQTGILVHVNATRVVLVDLAGKPLSITRETIRSLVLHQVLENPLTEISPGEQLGPLLRQVWTEKTARPSFVGWVSGFHDDLLIFFDLHGKSHVLQAEEIVRIRPFTAASVVRPAQHRVPQLVFPPAIVPCGARVAATGERAVMPSRVLADRIKIDDLLTALADRYRGFAGLEERTRVYARPFHYQPTLRLGLTYAQNSGVAQYFPFYFNYTGGTPYRFQSRVLLGSIVHEALPFMRRSVAASSDLKSHFFHATFVGQLPALSAESDAFLADNGEVARNTITTSYNYLILMGLDYWRLSASAGPAYFSFRIAGELETLAGQPAESYEVTARATSVTPVFRLQFRAENWTARALYYRTRLSTQVSEWDGGYALAPSDGPAVPAPSFVADDDRLNVGLDAFRLGATARLPLRLTASVDQIVSFISAEVSQSGQGIEISYLQSETALMIGAEFGRYIAVKAFARLLVRRFEQTIEFALRRASETKTRFDPFFGGALEFVFEMKPAAQSSTIARATLVALEVLIFVVVPFGRRSSQALNVNAVYRAACEREVGVILRVEKRRIHLLRQDGSVAEIPRHEIVSLVYYPVVQFPLTQLPPADSVRPVRIGSRDKRRWVELAFGWPINFSERKMSLLLPSGEDFSVDRDSVWSLEYGVFPSRRRPPPPPMPRFEHPHTSAFCAQAQRARGEGRSRRSPSTQPSASRPAVEPASQPAAAGAAVGRPLAGKRGGPRVFPQQILNDQVVIRRELNRLMEGYEELVDDIGDQKFYAVPQLYRDRTTLGFWGSFFSRYGASESRSNNLTPLLTNTFSSGPFRYQHIFLTGSAPNQLLIHNESQTQIFYRFKAAYFHTSLLIDPNLALVGEKYFWRSEDLQGETLDDRVNEYAIVELGFDWGPLAFQVQPVSMASGAVKQGNLFSETRAIPLWRAGARLAFPDLMVELMGGVTPTVQGEVSEDGVSGAGRSDWRYAYGRLNLGWNMPWRDIALQWWTVVRHLSHEVELWQATGAPVQRYRSLVVSSALQLTQRFWHRFETGAHVVLEVQRRQRDDDAAQTRVLPKFSLFASMSF